MTQTHESIFDLDRVPPSSTDAEQCLISSLMLSGNDALLLAEMTADLAKEDFYNPDNGILFAEIVAMKEAGQPVDAITLRERLESRGLLAEIGGTAYLATSLATVPSSLHGPHYAKIVREKSKLRQAITAANDLIRQCYAPQGGDAASDDIIQDHLARVATIANRSSATRDITAADMMRETLQWLRSPAGLIRSGITGLDVEISGFAPGETIIVAARPSMGKSTALRSMALEMALAGVRVGYISQEEQIRKIGKNLIANQGNVENYRMRDGVQADDSDQVDAAAQQIASLPMWFSCSDWHVNQIKSRSSMWKAKHDIQVLFFDYLQLAQADGKTQYERVSAVSRELALHVRKLGIVGIFAAQLNRANENREDRRPRLSDLRDSGQIEQDADCVLMLHREDYYGVQDPTYELTRTVEFQIAKFRDGMRGGIITVNADLEHQRFYSDAPVI